MKRFLAHNLLLLKESFFCMLFSFLVLGMVTIIGLNLHFFTPFNNAFKDFSYLDLYFSEELDKNEGNINQEIVLVNIDRMNRLEMASAIKKIDRQRPKVIGLDVIFKEVKDQVADSALAQSHTIENLVTTYTITDSKIEETTKAIAHAKQNKGYSNFSFSSESSVVRNFQGLKRGEDAIHMSFGAKVAKEFLKDRWNYELETYLLKERPINYKGNRENFLILEKEDVMNHETIPMVKDNIVLMGYLGDLNNHRFDIEDKHFTPMNIKFVGKSVPDTFGLVIHANIIHMILSNDFIWVVPNWMLVVLTVILTYLALAYFIWLSKKQLASYILRLNIIRLVFIVLIVWFSLSLFRNGVLLKTAGMIAVAAFSVGLIGYYKKLAQIVYKKYKWNGYLYHD